MSVADRLADISKLKPWVAQFAVEIEQCITGLRCQFGLSEPSIVRAIDEDAVFVVWENGDYYVSLDFLYHLLDREEKEVRVYRRDRAISKSWDSYWSLDELLDRVDIFSRLSEDDEVIP